MALNRRLIAAFIHHNATAVMSFYSDDSGATFFEDILPFQFNKAALAKETENFFKSTPDFRATIAAYSSVVSGDLAARLSSMPRLFPVSTSETVWSV